MASRDGLPADLEPLSRLLARLLRHSGKVRVDQDKWCQMKDLLRFTPGWSQQKVEVVVALSLAGRARDSSHVLMAR